LGRPRAGADEQALKEIYSNYDNLKTKSKEEKNKKNGNKKNAHRGQSVRYRSWWKQGNINMALSEDHASCWVHKDLTVTTEQIRALLTAAKASGRKDERQVRLTGTRAHRLLDYFLRSLVIKATSIKFEQIELPAKILDYFLRSNKSNMNQSAGTMDGHRDQQIRRLLLQRRSHSG